MTVRIIQADVFDGLKGLADESVHCCITSPPYWGLRDYGVAGQLGLEPTLGEHIAKMVEVFREVRRVLRKDGTLWLNYGDCYATSVNGRSAADTKSLGNDDRTFRDKPFSTVGPVLAHNSGDKKRGQNGKECYRPGHEARAVAGGYLKPKDLCGVPWRVALALQEDGWWLRQDIIWSKPNPMPESIKDRCTKAHEYLFLLAKSERYYFDAKAIEEEAAGDPEDSRNRWDTKDYLIPGQKPQKRLGRNPKVAGWQEGALGHGHSTIDHARGRKAGNKSHKYVQAYEASDTEEHRTKAGLMQVADTAYATRNKRSVWEVATSPYPDAHFATFPPALIEPCIKASTSENGCCSSCGEPWVRETARVDQGWDGSRYGERAVAASGGAVTGGTAKSTLGSNNGKLTGKTETIGWSPSCKCDAPVIPGTVLDPFLGSGTTALVADRLGRNCIGIELNADYAAMARKRIEGDAPLFTEVTA